jgi:hypothetical protein
MVAFGRGKRRYLFVGTILGLFLYAANPWRGSSFRDKIARIPIYLAHWNNLFRIAIANVSSFGTTFYVRCHTKKRAARGITIV